MTDRQEIPEIYYVTHTCMELIVLIIQTTNPTCLCDVHPTPTPSGTLSIQYVCTYQYTGINCYCSEEPSFIPDCHWNDYTCSGDKCYVYRQLRDGVFYTVWDCLSKSEGHAIDLICNGAFNTDTGAYACCSDGDNCNEHLDVKLPIEITTLEEAFTVSSKITTSTTNALIQSTQTIVPMPTSAPLPKGVLTSNIRL